MNSLPEQFSAVRKAQFEAQFEFFNSMTTQALDSASRVAALNLAVSRDTVQRSLDAGFSLLNSRDPRDVLCLGGQANEQVRSLFAYGRELLGIASSMRPYAVRPQALALAQPSQLAIETVEVVERSVAQAAPAAEPALAAPAETPVPEPVVVTAPEPVVAVTVAAEAVPEAVPAAEPVPATAAVAESAPEPAVEPDPEPAAAPAAEPAAVASAAPLVVAEPEPALEPLAIVAEPVPVAEPKAIAKAAGKGSARAAAASHPAAAPVTAIAANEGVDTPKQASPQVSSRRKK